MTYQEMLAFALSLFDGFGLNEFIQAVLVVIICFLVLGLVLEIAGKR